jgi:CUB domain
MFAAVVSSVCSATGVNLTASSGTITSPNYPNNYDNYANCQWRIIAPVASAVSFWIYFAIYFTYEATTASSQPRGNC